MKACCPLCDALCSVRPGRIIDGRRQEYNPEPHVKPVCKCCHCRVVFESQSLRDPGTWVCALCGVITEADVDTTTGPSCKGKPIR